MHPLTRRAVLLLAAFIFHAGLARAEEIFKFPSAEFAGKYEMSRADAKSKPIEVFGYLSMPTVPVSGKLPVVVIAHGSAGVEPKDREFWAPYFNRLGFAALVVDSFTPRGVTRTVDDQTLVSRAANTVDAFYALKALAADPRFDANKIGIIGFSRGGGAANETANKTFKTNVLGDSAGLQYAFHIPMYLNCQDSRYRKNGSYDKTGAPMLFLVGSNDDYTPGEQCVGMIEALQAEYPNVIDYRMYLGARHSFDADHGVGYLANGVTARDCPVLEIDLKDWSMHIVATGERLPLAKQREMYKTCVSRGVSFGTKGPKYRDMAAKDIRDFLHRTKILD